MGIFDFVFGAGDKVKAKSDEERGTELEGRVKKLGLKVDKLDVKVSGEKATVTGVVESQKDAEKLVLALGNTEGIAKVDDQLEVVKKKPPAQFYMVRSGDTLSKIAKEYYGDPMKYPDIFEANKPMLKDPDKIYPGQMLRIPPAQ